MNAAGIVLCGGGSRRMGQPKETLPFGGELMLQRVVRLVREAVQPVVVVAAAGQGLPELPEPIEIVRDRRPDRGPLEGIASGLRALQGRAEVAFVTTCDAPLLRPALIRRLIELSESYDAAVPHVAGFDQPLSAVYRVDVLKTVETLLSEDVLRPIVLFDRIRSRRVLQSELSDVDADLDSFVNMNSPDDSRAALVRAGLGE